MPWQQQQHQGQQGLRIAEPTRSTEPDRRPIEANKQTSVFNLCWDDDEDTKPGIGPVGPIIGPIKPPETKMFPPYKSEPKPAEELSNKLFVFGLCRKGFSLNIAVRRDKGFMGAALTLPFYRMLNINEEFPVVVEGGNTAIVGEVYEVENRTLDFLDSIEDCPSTQARKIITLEGGMRAHCYLLNRWKIPSREENIPSGDWHQWKRSERARDKTRKEKFKAMMAQGKIEAARKRAALEASLNGTSPHNPMAHGATLLDPISGKRQYVPPSGHVAVPDATRTVYVDTRTGKKTVHISEVPMMDLRIKLRDNGIDPDGMDDIRVRMECMTRYQMWYEVDC